MKRRPLYTPVRLSLPAIVYTREGGSQLEPTSNMCIRRGLPIVNIAPATPIDRFYTLRPSLDPDPWYI